MILSAASAVNIPVKTCKTLIIHYRVCAIDVKKRFLCFYECIKTCLLCFFNIRNMQTKAVCFSHVAMLHSLRCSRAVSLRWGGFLSFLHKTTLLTLRYNWTLLIKILKQYYIKLLTGIDDVNVFLLLSCFFFNFTFKACFYTFLFVNVLNIYGLRVCA